MVESTGRKGVGRGRRALRYCDAEESGGDGVGWVKLIENEIAKNSIRRFGCDCSVNRSNEKKHPGGSGT